MGAERWPWPGLDVFVLGSRRPEGTPDEVVVERDPKQLLERLRAANRGGDIHLEMERQASGSRLIPARRDSSGCMPVRPLPRDSEYPPNVR